MRSHKQNIAGHSEASAHARIITGDDEAALLSLWREKRGEIEPDDLIVQLGVVAEPSTSTTPGTSATPPSLLQRAGSVAGGGREPRSSIRKSRWLPWVAKPTLLLLIRKRGAPIFALEVEAFDA